MPRLTTVSATRHTQTYTEIHTDTKTDTHRYRDVHDMSSLVITSTQTYRQTDRQTETERNVII